jgi:hypothetical protein
MADTTHILPLMLECSIQVMLDMGRMGYFAILAANEKMSS